MSQDAARAYWRFTVLWLFVGCALGTLAGLSLLTSGTIGHDPLPGYGRLVAAHRAVIIHGVLFSAMFGVCFTLLPRMNRAVMESGPISLFIACFGTAVVIIGTIGILIGLGSGREYADFPSVVGFVFWLYLLAVALDLGFQIMRSKTFKLQPSQGLLLTAAIIPAVVYPFGLPDWLGTGFFAALRTWIGWRTIFLVSFAVGAIGLSLWMPGKDERKKIIARGPYIIGIILLIATAPFTGIVHLLDAPIPSGLKAWGAFAGGLSATAILLLVFTSWRKTSCDPPGFLFVAGLAGLAACAIQGAFMVVPPIHSALHFTMNTSGHAHLALGSILCVFLSGALVLAPRLSRHELVEPEKAMPAAVLIVAGLGLIFFSMTSTGIVQATAMAGSSSGLLQTVRWIQLGTLAGGIAALIGAAIIGVIVIKTLGFSMATKRIAEPAPQVIET